MMNAEVGFGRRVLEVFEDVGQVAAALRADRYDAVHESQVLARHAAVHVVHRGGERQPELHLARGLGELLLERVFHIARDRDERVLRALAASQVLRDHGQAVG